MIRWHRKGFKLFRHRKSGRRPIGRPRIAREHIDFIRRISGDHPEWAEDRIAEACAVAHVRRFHPTFYIKAEGEVDITYVEGKRFQPIEVKWTQQLRPKDLKQIAKYGNGRIWARTWSADEISGIPVEPLPLALYRLGGVSRFPG